MRMRAGRRVLLCSYHGVVAADREPGDQYRKRDVIADAAGVRSVPIHQRRDHGP